VFPVLKILLLFLVILVDGASARDSLRYRCPRGDAVIPASCLEDMKVSDVSRSLSAKERHQLAYLFAKSYVVSKVKYGQDYYVNHDAPISLLLTATFPELVKLRREGGIWLRDVFYFFRSRSEYRVDVERAVRELPASKRRQFGRLRDSDQKPNTPDEQAQRHSPLLKGVDHFFAYSSEPEVLFRFFRDTLGLPQVWDFKDFGDFASGGVWMGNVEFEVVTWKPPPGQKPPTEFKGIAFEPAGYTNDLVQELDRRSIKHTKPEPTLMKDKEGREFVGWINTGLDGPDGIPPSNVSIFVFDSTSKEKKAARIDRSNAALEKLQGGPLGVVAVKELAIGVVDLKTARIKWAMLMDRPDQESGGSYRFSKGPAIRLSAAPTDGFKSIVLQVRSLLKAKEFLAQRNLLSKTKDNQVAIDLAAIGGLRIFLEQIN